MARKNIMFTIDRDNLKRSILQVSAIVVFTVLLALCVNALRPGGILLVKDWSVEARIIDDNGVRMNLSLDEAVKAFEDGSAVFLDARPPAEYAMGHIKGARLLPFDEAEEYLINATSDISPDSLIITYCDGQTCMLSHDLALFLKRLGFERVYVLTDGWSLWLGKSLPVEHGTVVTQGEDQE